MVILYKIDPFASMIMYFYQAIYTIVEGIGTVSFKHESYNHVFSYEKDSRTPHNGEKLTYHVIPHEKVFTPIETAEYIA